MKADSAVMKLALDTATENVVSGKGGPFGAVIVRGGEIVTRAANTVTTSNDPTAHAEVNAIREACRVLQTFQLPDCEMYTSCEPCPMCLGAIYWARLSAVYYANTKADAADAGFDDAFIYEEIALPPGQRRLAMIHVPSADAAECFDKWRESALKISY